MTFFSILFLFLFSILPTHGTETASTTLSPEFHQRYANLRREIQATLDQQKGEEQVALIRDLAKPELSELTEVIPRHCPVQAERLAVDADDLSMRFNNTYAFAPREVRDTGIWSRQTSGAIDINPAYNPVISRTEHDWSWGGRWKSLHDYHHFSPGNE
ncbi:MAG TPA: M15 family metallopeptidase [Bdellovibrionota bacterium]|nr:M15 family metallopeptidase [Bdellovibrionota bacterium]